MKKIISFISRAKTYALDVTTGDIPGCVFTIAACQRFIDDLKRTDIELTGEGDRWCRFLEKLPHVKGRWAHKQLLLALSDWQIFLHGQYLRLVLGQLWQAPFPRGIYLRAPQKRKNILDFWPWSWPPNY